MNHVYRLVWSRARGMFVLASEISRGTAKAERSAVSRPLIWLAALPLGLLPLMTMAAGPVLLKAPVMAPVTPTVLPQKAAATIPNPTPGSIDRSTSPTGGKVTAGSGNISQSGLSTTIDQHSQNLSLNWLTFNIGADGTVNFIQPNAQAIAVNRIADPNGSVILGKLNANGQVFLINPNGVLFGQGAQVNVGGLVASTLDISDSELGSSSLHFSGGSQARIVNQGTITADGGYAALVAAQVVNDGTLSANGGSVAMGGGNAVTLRFDGNQLLGLQVDKSTLNALAENNQLIVANGGQVLMSAGAKDALLASTVNNAGVINAGSVSTEGGVVRLLAHGGNTINSGSIDVSGVRGGSVQLLSDQGVSVTGHVDASGALGGGDIRVGGGFRGGEGLLAAASSTLGAGTSLNADATQSGDGGSVVVWGNHSSTIAGSLSAHGGAQGGNGGTVETSAAHVSIADSTRVTTLAPNGRSGEWLIDPRDFTIAASGGDITGATLTANLGGGNVTIESSNGSSNGNGDVNVNDAVSWGANTLTLVAANNVNVNAALSGSGTSALVINPATANGGEAAVAGGVISINSNITTGGSQTYNGPVILAGNVAVASSGGSDIDFNSTVDGAYSLTASTSGAITFDGAVGGSVALTGLTTTSGALSAADTLNIGTGGLSVTTSGGGITQAAAFTVAGESAFNAGANAITLNNAGNDFTGAVNLTGGTTHIRDASALTLGMLATGDLSATSAGALVVGTGMVNGKLSATGTSITIGGSLTGLTDAAFSGAAPTGNGSLTGTGAISGLGNAAFTLSGLNAGTVDGVGFSGFTSADATHMAGANGFNDGAKSSGGMTFALVTDVEGTGTISNVAGRFDDGARKRTGGTITYTGFDAVAGSGGQVVGVIGDFELGSKASSASGLNYSGFNLTSVSGNGSNARITGSGQTYALVGADAGSSGGVSWTGFGNLADATGTVHFGTGGSVSGNVTAWVLDYASHGTAVTFNLSDGTSTGIGGTWSGVIAVAGSGGSDTISGSNQTYSLTGNNAGSNGTVSWSSFENLSDSAAGNFVFSDGARVSSTLAGGGAGTLDYAAYTTAVNVGLGGTATGTAGWSGIITAKGGTAADTINGNGQTYTLDDAIADKGSSNGFGWTSFENINDTTGTVDFGTGGSLGGNLTAATLDYGSYVGPVTVNLSGSGSTGVGGMLSGITALVASGDLDVSGTSIGSLDIAAGGTGAVTTLGQLSIGSNLTIGARGAVLQSDSLTVAGATSINAGGNSITLANAGNDFGGAVDITGGTVAITDANALTLGTVTADQLMATSTGRLDLGTTEVSGALVVTSNGGAVVQSGVLQVDGTTELDAGTGDVMLTNAGNDFTGAVDASGGTISLHDMNDLTVASLANGTNQAVTLVAGGALNVGPGAIDTGTANLTLTSNGGALATQGALSGANVSLSAYDGLTLGNSIAATGVLALHSTAGDISQTSGNISASTLSGNAAGHIALGGVNQISALGDVAATTGLNLTNGQALAVNGVVDGGSSTALTTLTGDLTVNGALKGSTVSLTSAGAIRQGAMGVIDAATLTGSSQDNTVLGGANRIGTLGNFSAANLSLTNAQALTVNGLVSGGNVFLTSSDGITLGSVGQVSASGAGDALILTTGGNFTNHAGSNTLGAVNGRWLVWSQNPTADLRGGLAYDFKQYNATSGSSTVLGSGNGFLYTLAPVLTATLTGDISKVYDGTTDVTLTAANYVLTGVVDGDTVTMNTVNGHYDDKNAGTGKVVSVSGVSFGSVSNGSALVYGYQVQSTATATIGTITPAPLTAGLTGSVSKVYDGGISALLGPGNYVLSGFIGGESATVIQTLGSYNSKDVADATTVTAQLSDNDFVADTSTLLSNYSLPATASGAGNITQLGITVDATASDKIYDATTNATIALGSSGILAGDTVVFTGTGTFADKNAGTGKSVTVDGIAASGADAGNYAFNTTATDTADIRQFDITVDAAASDKVYDATTNATIALGSSGILADDTVAFTGTGAFTDKNAGIGKNVTVDGITASGADAGNYTFNTTATDTADITPATLTYHADSATFQAGQEIGGLDGTVSGFLGSDTIDDSTSGALVWDTQATSSSPAGRYAIQGGGLSAGNYVFEQAPDNATALQIENDSATGTVIPLIPAIAGLQQQDDESRHATLQTPDVHIVDGGVRLP